VLDESAKEEELMSSITVTMEDIANRARVSKMTVSRALRNERISFHTRKRILKIAKSFGYRVNPILSRFSSHSKRELYRGTIGVIDNFPVKNGVFRARGFRENFDGATERANVLGFKLEPIWIREPGMSRRRITKILQARNIQGLLLAPQPEVRSELAIDWELFSVVAFGYTLEKPRFHMVSIHQLRMVQTSVKKLRSLGYQRIGLAVSDVWDKRVNHAYVAGYLIEQQHSKKRNALPPFLSSKKESFLRWFQKYKPDAVITTFGVKMVLWFEEAKIRIPQDVGLVDFAQHPAHDSYYSRMDSYNFETGKRAVDLLVGMMGRNERGVPKTPIIHLMEGEWRTGKTTCIKNDS
jgi:LacI family transcriptional regulator